MEIVESSHPQATVLALNGRLDGHSSPMVTERLDSVLARGAGRLVLDLGGLEYVSSAGLRVFLMAAKKGLASGSSVSFAGLSPAIREVFALSGFLDVLSVQPTVAEALAHP
jgi:anti-sigma B factor antagonist